MKQSSITILSLCVMLFAFCINCHAQKKSTNRNIQGTWMLKDPAALMGSDIPAEMQKADVFIVFGKSDATISMNIDMSSSENNMSVEIGIKATVKGTYKLGGEANREITFSSFDEKASTFDLYKFNIKLSDEQKAALAAAGMTEDTIKDLIKSQVNTKNITQNFQFENEKLYIVEQTATTLKLKDMKDNKILDFVKK